MQAAIYVRASTEMQTYSTANQTASLREYADRHGHEIVRTYEDDGRSGLTLEGRPGLRQLIQDALSPARGYDLLLVYDISRWGRFQDTDESAHYEFLCRRAGLEVIYVAEPFANDGTPMATIMKAIKRGMAAEYSRDLSVKVAKGKRRLAEQGFAMTVAPYGLRRLLVDQDGRPKFILERGDRKALQSDHVVLVPGPHREQVVVRRMFRLYVDQGFGYADIARFLNKREILNNSGSSWTDLQVKHTLQNEIYIGHTVYGRTRVILKGKAEPVAPAQWVRRENVLPSIVPKRLFRQVQARVAGIERSRTDEFFLRPLRDLYKREGYLSATMIDAEPGMPNSRSYVWRFRGITNAYLRVGYISPHSEMARWSRARAGEPDREALLAKLKQLLDREGRITGALLNADPDMPSKREVEWAFDNLRAAYQLVGFTPIKGRPRRWRKPPPVTSPANDL